MLDTKKKILDTARLLFNQHGYAQVTIRMIAQQAGMSSGNLNYHFRRREDILEALYFEMVAVFDQRISRLPTKEISLEQIREDIRRSMEHMIDYQFFWTDLYNLLRLSAAIRRHFMDAYQSRLQGYQLLFAELQRQQLMRPPEFEGEYRLLAERMITQGNTWIYMARLYEESDLLQSVGRFADALLAFLYPQLSKAGKRLYRSLLAN